MENLSHTLAGMLLAETAFEFRRGKGGLPPSWRRTAWVSSVVANNFPDLDIIIGFFFGKMGYLLHHRGHTHTFLGGLVSAGVLYLLSLVLRKKLKMVGRGRDELTLFFIILAGLFLHVLMDSLNSYWVHPFWP